VCYIPSVKPYVHARIGKEDRALLDRLKHSTGRSESELVRRGLRLVAQELGASRSARELAGVSVGKFTSGPRDLSTNRTHLDGFGAAASATASAPKASAKASTPQE
jgi:Arc/MetJ-type ribon-helix-helix transcriptional regulator